MSFEGKIDEDNEDEDEDQRKSPGSIKNNLLQSWRQFRAAALFAVGQYELKLTKKFDPIQTKLLASECLAKVPSLMYCIDYLEKGADPNAIIGDGLMRPLHAVAKKSNVLLVQSLVDAGADINAQNGRNQTPLIIASDSIITESSYIAVIRYFARRANCKIELRDVGGNTALLNGIYRNNVWITRELLLAGAQLTLGEGSPYEISLFIFAESLSTEPCAIPEHVLSPWKKSCFSRIFSPRGRYDYLFLVLLQLWTNSDISFIYRMIHHRRMELENEGVQLKAFHPYGTRSPEQLELEEQLRQQEELEKLKQRTLQREERQDKKKSSRKKMREARERERWDGVLKGIEAKVNQEYGFQSYPQHEPTQTWKPMSEETKKFEEKMTRHGYHSIGLGSEMHRAEGKEMSESEISPGKRWKVVEVRKQGVYSVNPYPGARDTKPAN